MDNAVTQTERYPEVDEQKSLGRPLVDMANPLEANSGQIANTSQSIDDSPVYRGGFIHFGSPYETNAGRDGQSPWNDHHHWDSGADVGAPSGQTNDAATEQMIQSQLQQIEQQLQQLVTEFGQPLNTSTGAGSSFDNVTSSLAGDSSSNIVPQAAVMPTDGGSSTPSAVAPADGAVSTSSTVAPTDGSVTTTTTAAPTDGSVSTTTTAAPTDGSVTTTTTAAPTDGSVTTTTTAAPTDSAGTSPSPTTSPDSTANFSVQNGQIIGPNGQPFEAKGINVNGTDSNADEQAILNDFPGLNFIRLDTSPNGAAFGTNGTAASGSDSISQIQQFINTMTAQGIVVEVENHVSGGVPTGSEVTDEDNWISQIAAQNKDNPYVWFGSSNEPSVNSSTDVSNTVNEQQQFYDAVRNTGNNNMIMLEVGYGSEPQTSVLTQNSDLDTYKNVAIDAHFYNDDSSGLSYTLGTYNGIDSADGQMPVVIGEYGPTGGTGEDPNTSVGASYAEAVQSAANSGEVSGAVAWEVGQYWLDPTGQNAWTDSDRLATSGSTNSNGQQNITLTSWGQEVASWINSGQVGTDAP